MENLSPKERVLKAATQLFHQNGYNATGINAIIEYAKVAKASFYDHYKTKDDLGVVYLEHRHKFWFEGLTTVVEKQTTSKKKVTAVFEYIKEMNIKENYRGCAFLNMLSEIPRNDTKIYEVIHRHKSELQTFFQHLVNNKEQAFMIYMLFEACLTESQLYQNQDYIDKTIKLLSKNTFQ
ncbi:TetR/AcrR family transcriptional regulator [Pedobacter frigoris]|uniref:TetR/AcrR family transcriptional regulator n=1 Tax=Pedobacter frigoris TaxID=2571272 RepID=A0A4U1CIF5_9SPHI|nr:TetR/AcrR family transcriptional regulator [Pedobacter frigoris]TKC05816.1 TetR/AcrR family transcriptional regulator [Pedobacter frigoris]